MSTKQEPVSKKRATVKAENATVHNPSNYVKTPTKPKESTPNKEPKPETKLTESNKSTVPANDTEQPSAEMKCTKVVNLHTEKQSKPEKVVEIKAEEPTDQNSSSADAREKKREKQATTEATKTSKAADAIKGASGKHSEALQRIKATEKYTKEEPMAPATPAEEPRAAGINEHAKCPAETSEGRDHRSEFPRAGTSRIPEPIRRLADDRSDVTHESTTDGTAESEAPVTSPTGRDDAKPVVSGEQPIPTEQKHDDSGRIVKGIPINGSEAEIRPHKPHSDDGASQEPISTGQTNSDLTTETNTPADKRLDRSSGLEFSANDSQAEEHTAGSKNSSTLIVRSTKSLVPMTPPLTPPPDTNKQSRRQRDRGVRGSQKTVDAAPAEPTAENQSRRSRHRWPPLEEKTHDRVEVDTNSQQVSWKTNKKLDSSSGAQSPWSSPNVVEEEAPTSSQSKRKVEFDDNFVDPAVYAKVLSANGKPDAIVPKDVTKQSSLLNATPDCVLERKPLISEDDDDEDDLDDDGDGVKKQFAVKNGNEDVATEHRRESNSNEEAVKLVEIDQNGIGSLVGLIGQKVDPDVRLASLRALVNLSWSLEKHPEFPPVLDQLCANVDSDDASLKLESLRILVNLSKDPAMVPHLLAAKAPSNLLKLLVPEMSEDVLVNWLTILDDILWTSKELCLTFASLPTEHRAASPETLYTGLYGLKNARILKSRIFVLSRHKSQQVTYLASRIYSCLTS